MTACLEVNSEEDVATDGWDAAASAEGEFAEAVEFLDIPRTKAARSQSAVLWTCQGWSASRILRKCPRLTGKNSL